MYNRFFLRTLNIVLIWMPFAYANNLTILTSDNEYVELTREESSALVHGSQMVAGIAEIDPDFGTNTILPFDICARNFELLRPYLALNEKTRVLGANNGLESRVQEDFPESNSRLFKLINVADFLGIEPLLTMLSSRCPYENEQMVSPNFLDSKILEKLSVKPEQFNVQPPELKRLPVRALAKSRVWFNQEQRVRYAKIESGTRTIIFDLKKRVLIEPCKRFSRNWFLAKKRGRAFKSPDNKYSLTITKQRRVNVTDYGRYNKIAHDLAQLNLYQKQLLASFDCIGSCSHTHNVWKVIGNLPVHLKEIIKKKCLLCRIEEYPVYKKLKPILEPVLFVGGVVATFWYMEHMYLSRAEFLTRGL